MNSSEFSYEICKAFGFEPTKEQLVAVETFAAFMFEPLAESVMVMRGSAGTGKTTLASAMVNTLRRLGQRVVLMAPTGRAAKVFSQNSGVVANTIHRKIYRQKTFNGIGTAFNLNNNIHKNTLFIVDESSMISNMPPFGGGESAFGSGSLLDDLIKYVYSGNNCHLMFIGDKAQLPPVGEDESPAIDTEVLSEYGLRVFECDMNKVLRQSQDSGILFNATVIRQMITHDEMTQLPCIKFDGFADIHVLAGDELIEQLSSSYINVGEDETMVIVRSNKSANIYNNGIRNMILDRDDILCRGDRIMVVKNKYLSPGNSVDDTKPELTFLANGDMAEVKRVRKIRDYYGFQFAEVELLFPDYDNYEMETTVILDSLNSESPSLTNEQQEQLFNAVYEGYFDVPLKADRMKSVREDPYYNALQIKYGYAVTCHKAQGGQWEHIYLDQGYMTDEMLTPDYIHWLYTAFTRAKSQLYLVNWPKTQILE